MEEISQIPFLEACGSGGPLRLFLQGPEQAVAECRALILPFAVIGRDPDADLCLNHPAVSRRHAYFQMIAGRVFYMDLQSRTGILRGRRSQFSGWLDAEGVSIGPFHLRLGQRGGGEGSSVELPNPTSRAFKQPGLRKAYLEYLDPANEKGPWGLSRSLVLLGRSPFCKVQLETRVEASLFHCSLVQTPAGVWVVDLLASSGTLVNGVRVRSARLNDGDEILAGGHLYRFRLGPRPPRHHRPTPVPARLVSRAPDFRGVVPEWKPPVTGTGSSLARQPYLPEPMIRLLLSESTRLQQEMAERMQQNMADQFHQALLMMFRMFTGMHQEQTNLIREELARIHELTEKQESLQAQLAALVRGPAGGDVSRPAPERPSPPGLGAPPAPDRKALPQGPGAGADAPEVRGEERPRAPTGHASDDVHAALIAQISALQSQRQGRWQRLLSAVIGTEVGGALP